MTALQKAANRIIMQYFHEDEPSPLICPEEDDHIRDDCLMVAEACTAHICHHVIVDARNEVIQSGYRCILCNAVFAAGDQ